MSRIVYSYASDYKEDDIFNDLAMMESFNVSHLNIQSIEDLQVIEALPEGAGWVESRK